MLHWENQSRQGTIEIEQGPHHWERSREKQLQDKKSKKRVECPKEFMVNPDVSRAN